jgi:hypothetical protein
VAKGEELDMKASDRKDLRWVVGGALVAGLVLALASCGQLSLFELMENEDFGSFTVQPAAATLAEGASVDILAQGGFRPYTLALLGQGVLSALGVYTAPDIVPSAGEVVEIEATDALGAKATSTLMIFARLALNQSTVALLDTETFDFEATGGRPPYDYYLDGVLVAESTSGGWGFPASPPGTYRVEVEDSQGVRAGATVTVVAVDPVVLAISPAEAKTTAGGAVVDFVVTVPAGDTYTVEAESGSLTQVGAITWRYTPPGFAVTDTVTLTDVVAGETVTATVTVLNLMPTDEPLAVSPAALSRDLAGGEQVVFTASGGVPPYIFRIDPDDLMGVLESLPPDRARYTAVRGRNNLDWVRLTDALGASVRVKVKSRTRR